MQNLLVIRRNKNTPAAVRLARTLRVFVAGVGATLLAAFLTGCKVGPEFKRPQVQSPSSYRDQVATANTNSVANLPWWELYKDPALTALIRTALTNNYDLRMAIARVEQARAVATQARAQMVPHLGVEGAASRGRNEFLGNANPAGPGGARTGDGVYAALNASWEIDLWGRIRRLNESARASFLATEEARRGITMSLIADVAQAYFELLELDARLHIAQRTTEAFRESTRIFNARYEAGGASKLDTARAEAALATTAANVPDLERQIALKENQISILLGQSPGDISRGLGLGQQAIPPAIPVGLPSELLERRPDIRQAEQNLRAANAQIGVSKAEFFPRIGLTTFFGKVSPELSAFSGGTANAWSMASSVTAPLFQGGALVGKYREAKAKHDEARLNYEQLALNALREVADALVTREKLELIGIEQTHAVQAYAEAVRLSMQRYVDGKAAYFEVLDAQEQLFPAENSLTRTELNRRLAFVQLYKALGGGWSTHPENQPQQ